MNELETRLARLLEDAFLYADSGAYREAAETYAVAADLAEETGSPGVARAARVSVRRMIVLEWARTRWPKETIMPGDVHIDRGRSQPNEITRFMIRRPHRIGRSTFTFVTVSRTGRVRIGHI